MNLIQAADLLKNLSDQQLVQANQNPTAVPPYLVLAEMKRREQVRAEFAKAQASQAQNKSVAQQTAENLMQPQQMQQGQPQQQQGQPQQGQPQQGQPQGIMQAAPPQVAAMAGGGHVARYAEGKAPTSAVEAIQPYMQQLLGMREAVPEEVKSTAPMTAQDLMNLYKTPSIEEKMAVARGLVGPQDYSQYESYLLEQMNEAKARKPRLGDALIAAGAAMASNRDPRVGIANILAQGIGAGSEAYKAQKEKQKKDTQVAMMAQMALAKMKQEDQAKLINLASSLASGDSGRMTAIMQTVEANRRANEERQRREREKTIETNKDISLSAIRALASASQSDVASSQALARLGMAYNKPLTHRQKIEDDAKNLYEDSISQARTYIDRNPDKVAKANEYRKTKGLPPINEYTLSIENIRNPEYFKGYSGSARQMAESLLIGMYKKENDQILKQRAADARAEAAAAKDPLRMINSLNAPTPAQAIRMQQQQALAGFGAVPDENE